MTPLAPANAPCRSLEPAGLLSAWDEHLAATRRTTPQYRRSAARFLQRWPDPQAWAAQPLEVRLAADDHTRPFLIFLMVWGWLRPGYDYMVRRKLASIWRDLPHSPMNADVDTFLAAAAELGYRASVARAVASQALVRVLIQTGRRLDALEPSDLCELEAAARSRVGARQDRHFRQSIAATRVVLFHLGVLAEPPARTQVPWGHERRLAGVNPRLLPTFLAYLERREATVAAGTVAQTVTRLAHFGRHLAAVAPDLADLAGLDRRHHMEPYLSAVAVATRPRDGARIGIAEQRARIICVHRFLTDITEWGWPEAPARQLIFASDIPRLPRPLPRYLPPDADRRLSAALEASPNQFAADALLLLRATGLRIGELIDLELDCVHEIPGLGAWLKVPLGKLGTERMVPLDDDTVALVDRIVEARSASRPLPHPRSGQPTEFLLVRHGRRLAATGLRNELRRAAQIAGLGDVVPHQLRHTYATALVNMGVSLQALMALLGHQSAAMSLRYGRLFDRTVRDDYERALTLAKTRLGPVLPDVTPVMLSTDWREAPLIKARLAGGYCLRTPAQGVCPYTNICEHCPNFRTDAGFLPILAAQRSDAEALATDAEARGWSTEAARHQELIGRLDTLMARAQAG